MYLWGGNFGLGSDPEVAGNGAIYDTSSSSWSLISTDSSIPSRDRHSAVVTGLSRMFIWGGHGGQDVGPMNDGGVLNLTTNTWTHIPNTLANTPTARHSHVAFMPDSGAFSGDMFIWGGETGSGDGGNPLTDGAVYTPDSTTGAAGTWRSMADFDTTGLEARSYFAWVWTGTKFIVWGGFAGTGLKNDGAVYDPATNAWTTMSTTSAPTARQGAKAIWTGSRMIVWGGYDGSNFLNNGAIYNPTDNSWSSLSTTSAPSDGRERHTIVWTGTRMIVWGGSNGSSTLNTGAIYDPDSNSWADMTSSILISGREQHTAVWVGNTMVICHGLNLTLTSQCGIYSPTTTQVPTPP